MPAGGGWVYRLALILAAATLLMILAGGMVTSLDAGDSDPEWSLRFWDWFRAWSDMPGGQLYEITHRQIGTVVGLLTLTFFVVLMRRERRWWVKYAGLMILTAVILQGLLGGLRVLLVSDLELQSRALHATGLPSANSARIISAMIHAALAQFIFGMLVAVVVVTSAGWFTKTSRAIAKPTIKIIRRLSLFLVGAIFIEMILGAYVRHASRGIFDHVSAALMVSILAIHTTSRVLSTGADAGSLRRPAIWLAILVQLQVFLGISSLIASPIISFAPTLHVIGGSSVLAAAVVLAVRSLRIPTVSEKS